jgi:hypothetical protein
MMQKGAIVQWTPRDDLHKLFPRGTAFRLYQMVPLAGVIEDISGNAARMSFRTPKGKEHMTVLLSECIPAGVAHAE